ncbi:MAG TPA: YfbM family protein [Catalimonadaceae bacterium]|nr:YfbM family protein [Catalimonadaceae bacterium]HPI10641.1 YfbM family protein [Catalimonadaceae bacterium]
MIGNYLRVSQDVLEEYQTDSSKLEKRVYSDGNRNDKDLIDVNKNWAGLFYLLTGQTLETEEKAVAPLAWILSPPHEIDPEQDMGYGPAKFTDAEQTNEVSLALQSLAVDELKLRYNGKEMQELGIYPEIWDEPECLEDLIHCFQTLQDFYHKAAMDGQSVIFFVD